MEALESSFPNASNKNDKLERKGKNPDSSASGGTNRNKKYTKNDDLKLSSTHRAAALELLKLQEAARFAADQQRNKNIFRRNTKLSHVAHASLNFTQFTVCALDETFHQLHHEINRRIRKSNPNYPAIPEERNPIFFLMPISMLVSLTLFFLWLCTKLLRRHPNIALVGNAFGATIMLISGISAMRHAEQHINLDDITDEMEAVHPIFIHNYVLCLISIFAMMLFLISAFLLNDFRIYQKHQREHESGMKVEETSINSRECHCSCAHRNECRSEPMDNSIELIETSHVNESHYAQVNKEKQELKKKPVVLYCCCVDWYRYLRYVCCGKVCRTHEFQVIQIM